MLILEVAVILLGILSVLTAVAVVALIRQVGVLHLRIQPVAGATGVGGPAYGSALKLPAALAELARRPAARFLIGFVSPTCGVCEPLTGAFGRIAKSVGADTAVLLVIDADQRQADEYVRAKNVGFLPYLADPVSFASNVPGAPWAIVTDKSGQVIASGGVNTLDNVEEMLAQADYLMANPPAQAAVGHGSGGGSAVGHGSSEGSAVGHGSGGESVAAGNLIVQPAKDGVSHHVL